MTLRRWRRLSFALMILALLLALINPAEGWLTLSAVGLMAAGLVIWIARVRCPECGAHLGRCPGEYCKYCGKKLDWDQVPRF